MDWFKKNGAVVKLLDTNNDGKVDAIDSTGDGQPNDIDEDGSFTSEVKGIEDNPAYQIGKTYWRGELLHFTPWDFNWPWGGLPPISTADMRNFIANMSNSQPSCSGTSIDSYVDCVNQVYSDDIKIAGTDLTLHYTTKRVNGYKYEIDVGNIKPEASAISVTVKLEIAGKVLKKEYEIDNLPSNVSFQWDGKDKYGKRLFGEVNAKVKLEYEYEPVYYKSNQSFTQAWAQIGNEATAIRGRDIIKLSNDKEIKIQLEKVLDTKNSLANGWSLSNHDIALNNFIQKGNGEVIITPHKSIITTIAGKKRWCYCSADRLGDGVPANEALYKNINGMEIDKNGNIYISTSYNIVRKIDTEGIITTFAGKPALLSAGYEGDNGPARDAKLKSPRDIAIDSKGNIYISDLGNRRIRKVDLDGIITTFAGNGISGYSGDGGLATDASFSNPSGIAVDSKDNIYFTADNRIRKVDTNGIITTIAGNGENKYYGNNISAIDSKLENPKALEIDANDNIYIGSFTRVRKIDKNGIIQTIAGVGIYDMFGDEGEAVKAAVGNVLDIEIDSMGVIYLSVGYGNKIRKILPNGIIVSVTGNNGYYNTGGDNQDPLLAGGVISSRIGLDQYGNIFVGSGAKIRKIEKFTLYNNYELNVGETSYLKETNILDVYDYNGNIIKTIDLLTNSELKSFKYDKTRLIEVKDQFNNEVIITRDSNGNPTVITAPDGQKTYLTIDEDGNLINISYEDNTNYQFLYDENSLMIEKK